MNKGQELGGNRPLAWRKSSYSGSGGGNCVEVATTPGTVHVRDSKGRQGPVLGFPNEEWSAFVAYAKTAHGADG
ncbi:DUF397 domain-containing protein [Streptomyces phaeochromogenes]